MSVRPIPDGYHSITPYLMINGAAEAMFKQSGPDTAPAS